MDKIEDPADLTDEDRATLERLADSDREAAPIYQWYLDRVEEYEAEAERPAGNDESSGDRRAESATEDGSAGSVSAGTATDGEGESDGQQESDLLDGRIMARSDRFGPDVLEDMTVATKQGLLDELREAEDEQ